MLGFLIFATVVCAILSSWFASLGKDYLLALNINMIVLNVAYLGMDAVLYMDSQYEFLMYIPVNIIGIIFGIRGIVRCRK